MSTIRFVRPNRYRKAVGELDSLMSYGVHDALVNRGIAEWVDGPVAVISEPVAVSTPEAPKRRSRRIATEEDRT